MAVNCGDDQTFTITPAGCYQIADVLVDGISVGAVTSYTFTDVAANHTIAASFAQTTYTITASAGTGGIDRPERCGRRRTAAPIRPSRSRRRAAYQIADVLVDGVSVGAVASYTFTDVTANHTIAATFAADDLHHHRLGRNRRLDQPERCRWP